jgi:hypothetical protein
MTLLLVFFALCFLVGALEGSGVLPKHETPPRVATPKKVGFWTRPRGEKGLLP